MPEIIIRPARNAALEGTAAAQCPPAHLRALLRHRLPSSLAPPSLPTRLPIPPSLSRRRCAPRLAHVQCFPLASGPHPPPLPPSLAPPSLVARSSVAAHPPPPSPFTVQAAPRPSARRPPSPGPRLPAGPDIAPCLAA